MLPIDQVTVAGSLRGAAAAAGPEREAGAIQHLWWFDMGTLRWRLGSVRKAAVNH